MPKRFLICIAPSETHIFHMVERLRAGGFANTRISTFLKIGRPHVVEKRPLTLQQEGQPSRIPDSSGLAGLGFPELEAQRYEEQVRLGRIVICVQTEDPEEMEEVMVIFQEGRGEEISSFSETEQPSLTMSHPA